MSHRFHPHLLRDYDLRGAVGETLHEADAWALGRSFGTVVRRSGGRRVAVGYDGRLSSPALEAAVVQGLIATGIDVLRIGLGPTPMLYHAEMTGDVDAGVQITGSHNPPGDNGFKLVHRHAPFFGADIQRIGEIAALGDWDSGAGAVAAVDLQDAYVDRLLNGFTAGAFRIGWDTGNGAAGPIVEKLSQHLPGEHHLLFTQVDGHFPNHHPDPSVEANLAELRALVLEKRLDFGVAFDGDGDRIGVIDREGRTISNDLLLTLFARDLLKKRPGAMVVADVKASQHVFDKVTALGGRPDMWKAGHSHIKSRMKQTGALLGGETTGHFFFADDHPGYDDALYAAVRLIRLLASDPAGPSLLSERLADSVITPELRVSAPDARKFGIVDEVRSRLEAAGAFVNALDGVRVTTAEGWWLLRASNTQPALVIRAESGTEEGLERLLRTVESQLDRSGVAFRR